MDVTRLVVTLDPTEDVSWIVPISEYANDTTMTSFQPTAYQLIWSPDVVFRVTTIIVVMAFTFVGNTTLISGIICHRKLRRKRVNIFLVNLAIGDLMVCFVTMTTEILFVAFGEWVMGAAACKIVVYGQIVTLASTTFLLTAMSIDRYQVIVQPFKSLTGQPKIWRKVLVAWMLAFAFAIPQLFIFVQTDEGQRPDGKIKHMCKSKGYTEQWQRKLSFSLMTVYILIIPTCIMTYCYVNIIRVVWMRTASTEARQPKLRFVSNFSKTRSVSNGEDSSPVLGSHRTSRSGSEVVNNLSIPPRLVSSSKRNVIKMTLSVIVGFVVCWTPYFVISLVRIFSDYEIQLKHALSVAEIMALVHSALNPIVYGIFSTHMARRACADMWRKCQKKEIVTAVDFVISDEDSSYWTETKIQHLSMNRMSIAQPLSLRQTQEQDCMASFTSFCGKVWAFVCCQWRDDVQTTAKPLLIYRKAVICNGHAMTSPPQYESFRLRAQSTSAHYPRPSENVTLRRNGINARNQATRSTIHLALPISIPAKSVSDSNIHCTTTHGDHLRSRDLLPDSDGRRLEASRARYDAWKHGDLGFGLCQETDLGENMGTQ